MVIACKVFEQWALDMLYNWHINDPVSQKEIDRNNDIFAHQDNRNPFIDNPQYVEDIWQSTLGLPIVELSSTLKLYPNPVNGDWFYINSDSEMEMKIFNTLGQLVFESELINGRNTIEIQGLRDGLYLVRMIGDRGSTTTRLIKR